MPTILDYLEWRGDLSFQERPFNDVDNVILSMLSYLDFTGIVPSEDSDKSVRLSHACRVLLSQGNGSIGKYVRSFARLDERFVQLMRDVPRFRDARLSNYVDIYDKSLALQFSALQIDLPSSGTYIAYRGTDNTLVGWREDFMMSFEVTEAQRRALDYLNRTLGQLADRDVKVRVGGHSKGGNLAEYASVCCDKKLRQKIVGVYTNDGPDMAPEVLTHDSRAVLGRRLHRIVPTYSVVGMLFVKAYEPTTIVKSNVLGIAQHDAMSWQTKHNCLDTTDDFQTDCKVINSAIATWAGSVGLDERERITNELFDALEASGAVTFEGILTSRESMKKVFKALGNADERTRRLVTELMKVTFNHSVVAMREKTDETLDTWAKSIEGSLRTLFQ